MKTVVTIVAQGAFSKNYGSNNLGNSFMTNSFKMLDAVIKSGLMIDPKLHQFLKPFFSTTSDRQEFIAQCLKKMRTRRMLLRAQWYTEIADHQSTARDSRPALNIIFLMGMAESLAKARTNQKLSPNTAAKTFFDCISDADKKMLQQKFRRTLLSMKHHNLRFSSIIRILYEIRNKAVHGEDFFSFTLLRQPQNTHSMITSGTLVSKRKNRRRVSLDIGITYHELRDIFRRTAIANIKATF